MRDLHPRWRRAAVALVAVGLAGAITAGCDTTPRGSDNTDENTHGATSSPLPTQQNDEFDRSDTSDDES